MTSVGADPLLAAMQERIAIQVNGEPHQIEAGSSVAQLLEALGVREARVAVEVNLDVIRREQRSQRLLQAGDQVEIVSFVGGGR